MPQLSDALSEKIAELEDIVSDLEQQLSEHLAAKAERDVLHREEVERLKKEVSEAKQAALKASEDVGSAIDAVKNLLSTLDSGDAKHATKGNSADDGDTSSEGNDQSSNQSTGKRTSG
ncbi:MAG: hypothetical protein AAF668_09405 [Pseudomonadota bacterium]